MINQNQTGIEYMIEFYLKDLKEVYGFTMDGVNRECLEGWIGQDKPNRENLDKIGAVLMDLERGGTTPKRFDEFRKTHNVITELYKKGSKKQKRWLKTILRELESEIIVLGKEYNFIQFGGGIINSACYRIGKLGEKSKKVCNLVIDEIFKRGGVVLEGSLNIPFSYEEDVSSMDDFPNFVERDSKSNFNIFAVHGTSETTFNKTLERIFNRFKKCHKGDKYDGIVIDSLTGTTFDDYYSIKTLKGYWYGTRLPRMPLDNSVLITLYSKSEQYANDFFERIKNFVHNHNEQEAQKRKPQ